MGSHDHPVIPAYAGISGRLLAGLDAVLRGWIPGRPGRLAARQCAGVAHEAI